MSQYGWRVGSVAAGALALVLAARVGWQAAYLACAAFALPAMLDGAGHGRARAPSRAERAPGRRRGRGRSIVGPFVEFFQRHGAFIVLLFILVHKIGDTLGQLVLRLLLNDLGYSNDEIAIYDVGFGFWAYLVGIFLGGFLYAQIGMKRVGARRPRPDGHLQRELRARSRRPDTPTGGWRAPSASRTSRAASAASWSSRISRR